MLEPGKLGGSPPSATCSTVLAHKDGSETRSQWIFLPIARSLFLPVKLHKPQASTKRKPKTLSHTKCSHLGSQLRAVLQNRVQDLHVVGVSSIGELIEDHKLDGGTQVVLVSIQQLPGHKSQAGEGGQARLALLPAGPSHHLMAQLTAYLIQSI